MADQPYSLTNCFDPAMCCCYHVLAATYDWAQSLEEVLIEVLVPAHTTTQEVSVKFGSGSLVVTVGEQPVINGQLSGQVQPGESSWKLGEYTASWPKELRQGCGKSYFSVRQCEVLEVGIALQTDSLLSASTFAVIFKCSNMSACRNITSSG